MGKRVLQRLTSNPTYTGSTMALVIFGIMGCGCIADAMGYPFW